jgi:hypothetical protein
LRQTV